MSFKSTLAASAAALALAGGFAAAQETTGAIRGTVTDDAGTFRVAGLPDGVYAVGVDHPTLRAARVRLNETRVVVEDRTSDALELWSPSEETIFARACPGSTAYGSTGAVLGVARDPVTGLPVPGVDIEVVWRVRDTRFVEAVGDVSGEHGEFVICRVPLGEPAVLRQKGAEEGAELELVTRVTWRDVHADPRPPDPPSNEAAPSDPAVRTEQEEKRRGR